MRYVPRVVLGLMMLTNFGRGLIHAFAPDRRADCRAAADHSCLKYTSTQRIASSSIRFDKNLDRN